MVATWLWTTHLQLPWGVNVEHFKSQLILQISKSRYSRFALHSPFFTIFHAVLFDPQLSPRGNFTTQRLDIPMFKPRAINPSKFHIQPFPPNFHFHRRKSLATKGRAKSWGLKNYRKSFSCCRLSGTRIWCSTFHVACSTIGNDQQRLCLHYAGFCSRQQPQWNVARSGRHQKRWQSKRWGQGGVQALHDGNF